MSIQDAPPRHRPRWIVALLGVLAALHVGAGLGMLRGWVTGNHELALLLGLLGFMMALAMRHPLRNEAALMGAVAGDLGLVLLAHGPQARWLAVLGWGSAGALGVVLWHAWQEAKQRVQAHRMPILEILAEARTQSGEDVLTLSHQTPVLLVCLRHFGCTFCREALTRLRSQRQGIAEAGTRLVLVHQAAETEAAAFLEGYGLADLDRVADPRRWLYFHLGLPQGGPWQLLGPRVWLRALGAGLLRRHGLGRVQGDLRQMPGVFLIWEGVVLAAHVARTAADNPDFQALAQCPPRA